MAHPDARFVKLSNGYPDWTKSRCVVCGLGWPCWDQANGRRCLTCDPLPILGAPVYSLCRFTHRTFAIVYHGDCADLVVTVRRQMALRGEQTPGYFEHIRDFWKGH
jgi:hypothetical protein